MTSGERASGRFFAVALLVYGGLYAMTAASSLQGGDSSELLVVVFRGGTAHPPGYPLYELLGHIAVWFPLLNPMLALSLFSTLCALGALITLRRALLRWGLDPTAAGLAVAVFGVTPPFWKYAAVPEVFALNAWLVALVLWACGRGSGPRGLFRAALIGLFVGLGLANHLTSVLVAPFAVVGLWRAAREVGGWRGLASAVGAGFAGLAVGLAPYLTLLGAPRENGWYWGGTLDVAGLFEHLLRRSYGTLRLSLRDMGPEPFENTAAYAAHLPAALGLLLPFAVWGLAGAVEALRRVRANANDAADAGALLTSLGLSSLVFLELANLRPEGLARHVLERFYVLPDLLACVLAAVGLAHILRARPGAHELARALGVGLVAALVLVHYEEADWSDDNAVEDYVFNALATSEPRGVVLGTGELQLFGFLAAREVLAQRSDVAYIDLNLLRQRWYYDRVRREVPELELPFDPLATSSLEVVADLVDERPVYLADMRLMPELERRTFPIGPLLRALPPDQALPEPAEVLVMNMNLFVQFQFRGSAVNDPTGWGALALSYYARTWDALAGAWERAGRRREAAQARAFAQAYELR